MKSYKEVISRCKGCLFFNKIINSRSRTIVCYNKKYNTYNWHYWNETEIINNCADYKYDFESLLKNIIKSHKNRRK